MNVFQTIKQFPLTRIIVYILLILIFSNILSNIYSIAFGEIKDAGDNIIAIYSILSSIIILIFYCFLVKLYEKREMTELNIRILLSEFSLGVLIGGGIQLIHAGIMYFARFYKSIQVNAWYFLLTSTRIGIAAGISEEIMFRGIILKILEENLGSFLALGISAMLFGAIHLLNADATLTSALGAAVTGGLVMGSAYIYTKSLWLPIGIHAGWNYFAANLQGTRGVETTLHTFLTATIDGPTWLTGGVHGTEVTIQELAMCLIISGVFLYLAKRKDRIVKLSI